MDLAPGCRFTRIARPHPKPRRRTRRVVTNGSVRGSAAVAMLVAMELRTRANFEIAALVLVLFSAMLNSRLTFVLAAVLLVALLGGEYWRRHRAS